MKALAIVRRNIVRAQMIIWQAKWNQRYDILRIFSNIVFQLDHFQK